MEQIPIVSATVASEDLLELAREKFIGGEYNQAEPLLSRLLTANPDSAPLPEVFQMLATIYYDCGQFNRAIKTFRRALEVDPTYTDAHIGLSIVLNDLGRYDEGRKVFLEAQRILDEKKSTSDPFLDRLLAQKHEELGDLYFENKRFEAAHTQYVLSRELLDTSNSITLKVAQSLVLSGKMAKGIAELKRVISDHPHELTARQLLGQIYFDMGRIIEAIEVWEAILLRDPQNVEARKALTRASLAAGGKRAHHAKHHPEKI